MNATTHRLKLTALASLALLAAPFALAQQATPAKDATAITRQDNLAVYKQLPFADKTDLTTRSAASWAPSRAARSRRTTAARAGT